MALKNPAVKRLKKALVTAYKRGEIREANGAIVPRKNFNALLKSIFGPKRDIQGRKLLAFQNLHTWVTRYHVSFPPSVLKAVNIVSKEKPKGFWDGVLDACIAVASHPAFSAVVGAATAAIPGVGLALAPIAVAVQRKVTALVADARDGNLNAEKVLSSAAEVAASGVSAASPQAAAMVNQAKTVVATARAVGSKAQAALTAELAATRRLIVKAQAGDAHAAASITVTVERAKKGDRKAIKKLALITAVGKGIKDGHVPKATKTERIHFGRIALHKLATLPPAARALAQSAAAPSSPVAKMTMPDIEESDDDLEDDELLEGDEDYGDEEDGGDETGLTFRKPVPARSRSTVRAAPKMAARKASPAKAKATPAMRPKTSPFRPGLPALLAARGKLPSGASPSAKQESTSAPSYPEEQPYASASPMAAQETQAQGASPSFPSFSVVPEEDYESDYQDDEEDDDDDGGEEDAA